MWSVTPHEGTERADEARLYPKMRYSVIIPHFADTDRLDRLLRTIPSYRDDIEVIVIDDCTPDQSSVDNARASWPRVHWLSTRHNAGAGAARNAGLAQASGDWLIFADSDDEFLEDTFEQFDQHLARNDELVYFLAEAVQEADNSHSNRADRMNELCRNYLQTPSAENLNRLRVGHVNPVAKIYSRFFILRIGVTFEETHVGNDVAFNVLAAIQATHVRVVPVAVYRVFRRAGSLTTREDPETLALKIRSLARLNKRLASFGTSARMHAGSHLYRAFRQGPTTFLRILRVVHTSGMLGPTLRHLSIKDFRSFVRRWRRARAEHSQI